MKNLIVNGDNLVTDAKTLADLVQSLELDPRKVALERNLEIVPRSLYGSVQIEDGDRLEIVQFVGGG